MPDAFSQRLYYMREYARILAAEDGFDYAAQNYFRIQDKQAFGMPTLKFNRVQRKTLAFMKAFQKQHGYLRIVIGKARQLGMSTLMTGLIDHPLYFRDHRNALVITHDEDTSKEMLAKHKMIYENLPSPLRPQRGTNTLTAMSFPMRHNNILCNHARNMNVGASLMQHIVHLSEVARYPDAATIQSSLFPSISDAKGDVFGDCSMIIMESTAFVGGEWFKAFAEDARAGKNGFGFLFIPWFVHEDYQLPVPKDWTPTAEEAQWLKQHRDEGLTPENLMWRRMKKAEFELTQLKGTATDNGALFEQEYPFSFDSAWVLPQGSSRIFKDNDLKHAFIERRGVPHTPTIKGLVRDISGKLDVFKMPEDGRIYDIGIDPSGGRDLNSDFTAIEVVDRRTLEQVAEAQYRWDPASTDFLEFVYWLGKSYNTAQLIIDVTGGWGQALLSYLQNKPYPHLWQRRQRDDSKGRVSMKDGFLYSRREKSNLISNTVVLLNAGEPKIYSTKLHGEMVTFLQYGLEEWGAAPGYYDDLINAYMMAILSATDERPNVTQPLELMPTSPRPDVEDCFYHDVEAVLKATEKKKNVFTNPRCTVHTGSGATH